MWKKSLALIFIAALAGCQKSPPSAEPPQKITVAYTSQPQSTLVHIAVAKGYFASEGLEVQSQMHTYGKAALQSVIENKADFATVAETPVMFNVLKGEKIFVIANIESSAMNDAIVARKDAGIAAPGDLKGKRIGFTPGTSNDFFLDTFLTSQGMKRREIHPIPLKPEEMQEAILAKKVDAVSTWNYPLTQIKRQLAANGMIFYDRQIYTETFNIAAQQAYVQNNPETVKGFLRALILAENFVAQHPEEAQSIMSARTQIDKSMVQEVWSNFGYRVTQDQTLLITLEDETRWAIKNKLTDQTVMPDYLNFIHLDSLRAVKPEAIRMNR
ncbi:MAG: NrtA/SsuA/CpmA family ABC transporter substrate-binding protein [Proteobacteria bacterium]|nr:NrtA/SsuA/CpmA family ABC transporter substrate-binding protein [Pseudomonadota bacterium]